MRAKKTYENIVMIAREDRHFAAGLLCVLGGLVMGVFTLWWFVAGESIIMHTAASISDWWASFSVRWWHWPIIAALVTAGAVTTFRIWRRNREQYKDFISGGKGIMHGNQSVGHQVGHFVSRMPYKAEVKIEQWEGPFTHNVRLDINARQPAQKWIGGKPKWETHRDTQKEADALIDGLQQEKAQKRMAASLRRACRVSYTHDGLVVQVCKVDGEQRTPRADRGLLSLTHGSKMGIGVDSNNHPLSIDFSKFGMTGVMGPPGSGKTQMLLSMAYMFLAQNRGSEIHVFCAPAKYAKDWGKLDGAKGIVAHTDYEQMQLATGRIESAMNAGRITKPMLVIYDDMTSLAPHLAECEEQLNSIAVMGRDLNTYMIIGTHGSSSEYLGGNKIKAAMGLKIMYRVANTTQGASVAGEKSSKHGLMDLSGLPGDAVVDYNGQIFRVATPWLPDEAIDSLPRGLPSVPQPVDSGVGGEYTPPPASTGAKARSHQPPSGAIGELEFVVVDDPAPDAGQGVDYSRWGVDEFAVAMDAEGYPISISALGEDDLIWCERMLEAELSQNGRIYCLMGNRSKPRSAASSSTRRAALAKLESLISCDTVVSAEDANTSSGRKFVDLRR